ncbi:hypothetical protein PTSG_10347 [Salpingoeca rosetta]|uniref:Uncharacterized protein n=1 Tax=Salpingoeca rosetta (strain ATCC 50818 / BSB-021) TaxID=946362 RepID=F2UR18_SALR5|nr:uncharacterized protein PTSG_10347 [Salpingoeca rosetta]EGD80073.1 hypothetical protein PTSG_10347 [Salpingoeca rosetta]|eukprot:XP_004988398.1 hypothetical protein PTSG_10347 [Salpingoeca rosetta]
MPCIPYEAACTSHAMLYLDWWDARHDPAELVSCATVVIPTAELTKQLLTLAMPPPRRVCAMCGREIDVTSSGVHVNQPPVVEE